MKVHLFIPLSLSQMLYGLSHKQLNFMNMDTKRIEPDFHIMKVAMLHC